MIKIDELTPADFGRWVLYAPAAGQAEAGRIKSWNKDYILVVYKCDMNWSGFMNYTACATKPEDLEFVK